MAHPLRLFLRQDEIGFPVIFIGEGPDSMIEFGAFLDSLIATIERRQQDKQNQQGQLIRHTNDPQNSHDVSVNAAKKTIISRPRAEQPEDSHFHFEVIKNTMNKLELTCGANGKIRLMLNFRAMQVLELINSKREYSKSAGATDFETLIRVFSRANDPRNWENASKITQAIFDALVDCWEEHRLETFIQCVDGRISRLLGALVLLDFDEKNWSFHRLEDLKNELFDLANKEIQACATEAAKSESPNLIAVGKAYLAKTKAEIEEIGRLNEETEKKWVEATKILVKDVLERRIEEFNDTVANSIPERFQQKIIEQALSAI